MGALGQSKLNAINVLGFRVGREKQGQATSIDLSPDWLRNLEGEPYPQRQRYEAGPESCPWGFPDAAPVWI